VLARPVARLPGTRLRVTPRRGRPLLVGVAYRLLGSVGDAEDVVQEAWLRWARVDTDTVADPVGFLIRTVSRLAIDRLRRIAARRESYVGPWLPEPLLTHPGEGPEGEAERASSVSLAILVVLETLSPLERTVFVLHEAFAHSHTDIADIIDRSPAAVRQLAHRARASTSRPAGRGSRPTPRHAGRRPSGSCTRR
jgi:RNA polymerase sigma-70 factor (ECF subfamily)